MSEAQQIQAQFTRAFGSISERYHGQLDRLRQDAAATDAERLDAAFDAHREAAAEYHRALADRNARLAERDAELRQELFGFGAPSRAAGQAFTHALLQAEGADDERLASLARLAAKTGDPLLGRAVFAVAHERGIADLALPYLNSDPEALEAYRELASMPTPAERERAERSGLSVPTLEAVKPTPEAAASAHRLEALERAERGQRMAG